MRRFLGSPWFTAVLPFMLTLLVIFAGCVEGPVGPGVDPVPVSGELELLSYEGETDVLLRSAEGYEALAVKIERREITTADRLLKAIGEVDHAARNDGYLSRDTAFTNHQYPGDGENVRWSPEMAAQGLRDLAAGKRRRAGQ
jgi:hypothetical protein